MCHVLRGRAVLAGAAWWALIVLGAAAFAAPALGADRPPLPKPDPPPKAKPAPPPPVSRPAPVAPQPVAPVAPTPVAPAAPAVVHPTAAERRAVAARKARAREVARAKRERAAARKQQAALLRAHARERRAEQTRLSGPVAGSEPSVSALPFRVVAFGLSLAFLGLALTPAWAVPWGRASRALEERRDELGVIGAAGLVATVLFFLLVQATQ